MTKLKEIENLNQELAHMTELYNEEYEVKIKYRDHVKKLKEALKPIIDKHNNHTLCRCEWDEEGYQIANDPECLHNKVRKALEET